MSGSLGEEGGWGMGSGVLGKGGTYEGEGDDGFQAGGHGCEGRVGRVRVC